jgi:hypothetical protein
MGHNARIGSLFLLELDIARGIIPAEPTCGLEKHAAQSAQ